MEYAPGGTEVVGLLVESWNAWEGGLTCTFRLEPGVLSHEGTPAGAAALKSSFERRMTADEILRCLLASVAPIEAPEARALIVTLNAPQTSSVDALASSWSPKAVSPAALAGTSDEGMGRSWLVETAAGTGPVRLAEFLRGRMIVRERFDEYHGEPAFFGTVEIPIVPGVGQQILQLRSQEIDAVPANVSEDLAGTASP